MLQAIEKFFRIETGAGGEAIFEPEDGHSFTNSKTTPLFFSKWRKIWI